MTKTSVDRYDLEARYAPALINSLPFFVLAYYYLRNLDANFWDSALSLNIGSISVSVALYLLAVNFFRVSGKLVEELIFKDGACFPTTELLLKSDKTYTDKRKELIIDGLRKKYSYDLRGKTRDTAQNRKLINEVIRSMRADYRTKPMVQQRNIQYGFMRNLLAGSFLSVIVLLVCTVVNLQAGNETAQAITSVLLVSYGLLFIASFSTLKYIAKQYAFTLFDEFLVSPKK